MQLPDSKITAFVQEKLYVLSENYVKAVRMPAGFFIVEFGDRIVGGLPLPNIPIYFVPGVDPGVLTGDIQTAWKKATTLAITGRSKIRLLAVALLIDLPLIFNRQDIGQEQAIQWIIQTEKQAYSYYYPYSFQTPKYVFQDPKEGLFSEEETKKFADLMLWPSAASRNL